MVTNSSWLELSPGDWTIEGEVKNKGEEWAYHVLISAQHYDADGEYLCEHLTGVSPGDLEGGEAGSFEIHCGELPLGHDHTEFYVGWLE